MTHHRFGKLILLLGVILSVGASAAAPPKGKGKGAAPGAGRDIAVEAMRSEKRVVLVIGNGTYWTSPLRNPVHDARAMARALSEVGFEVLAYENLSQKEMKRTFLKFRDHLRGGVGLFYFAGHGVQVNGRNYLIPIDVEIQSEEEVEVESVDVANVLARMETAKNRLNIVILDACRDNPFGRSFRSSARGLASIDAPTGTIIAYATAPGKVARDGEGQNGLYTGELLKAMRVPGMKIEEVFKRVRQAVQGQTRGEQVPWEASSLVGDFMFVLPEAVAAVPPPPKLDIREEVQQRFGSLAIRAEVTGAEVWLDDRQIGETKAGRVLVVGKLPAGAHRVKASKGGYQEWEREVEVAADVRAEVVIDLESPVSGGGTISGEVKYAGNPPAPKKLEITKDTGVCGEEKTSQDLIVGGNKGIKNAVVYIAGIAKGKPMDNKEAVLDQKGCEYHPHVQIVTAGAPIRILNSDGILHAIHTHSKVNAHIKRAQPKFQKEMVTKIEKAEIVPVKCDVYGWMSAVLVVADHPYYAITDENGAFRLTDVPTGTYHLKIWHETLGELTKQVTVTAGGDAKVSVELK